MTDVNETRALKASFRGALDTGRSLAEIQARVDALDDHADVDDGLLDDLARLTSAHAVASAALRGLVDTMRTRRAAGASA
ncbi:MAG: hypothetical protein H0W18_01340 [Acidobacteria bacterium]|nr:hypothetical protein [Acidobacteriota bacterium]